MSNQSTVHYNKQYISNEIRQLAGQQIITRDKQPLQPVAPILNRAKEVLTETYSELAKAAKQNQDLSSAGEWLLDNFYIIQEQIVQLKEDLPASYYRKLPRLKEGEFKGFPRVYELVQKLAVLSDNIIDQDITTTAVQAYQESTALKLGELWAIPILIRLSLIDRLAEKSEQLLDQRKIRERVERALEEMVTSTSDEPGYLMRKLPEIANIPDAGEQYLVVLAQRVQVMGLLTDTERSWFDYKFRRWNTTLEDQLRVEAQRTSRLHLSIQNAISTLREVSETDWSEFVENCSVVEQILQLDPSGYYSEMNFDTRDRYRKVIEKLSEHSSYTEPDVAREMLVLAENAAQQNPNQNFKASHTGYYLIGDGFSELAEAVAYKMPAGERVRRWLKRHPTGYFAFIGLHVLVLLAIAGAVAGLLQAPVWASILTLAAAFMPALDLAIVSTNRILSLLLPPRILPKLELKEAVPDHYRTMVVVPTLLTSVKEVQEQFENLEIRALANPNKELQFVLLSDFADAKRETMPSDNVILNAAEQQIKRLNKRYSSSYGPKFFLLHRRRKWNDSQQMWMGWERKRGKLEEFSRLTRFPDSDPTFSHITDGFLQSVRQTPVKYVITLDADTKLPPGSAVDMIRTIAHPLNRAELNQSGSFVEKGYGLIQPRISIPSQSAGTTWFTRIFSGNVGIDPYTTAVSDVYQDLFGEGIFTGKGIYDLEMFDTVFYERFPENVILSHDLLESTYLRCGLATDIELFDDYPTTYLNYTKRNHRWIRGDWQILHWLRNWVPDKREGKIANPINIISKWKIFDNLRRSTTPFFLMLFLLLGWTVLSGPALVWTFAVLGITAFPIYSSFSLEIFARPQRVKWKLYLEKIRLNMKINTVQAVTVFTFLPHQAYVSLDAVLRTLWRIFVSNKYLLEWTSASQTERDTNNQLLIYWKKMAVNVIWAGICIMAGWFVNATLLVLIVPFAIAWFIGPLLAYLLGNYSPISDKRKFKPQDIRELRIYARRTWGYFEQSVNKEHSWLPPDNIQEDPFIGAVGRTSPTNIGLGLASVYTAYEFGYLTLGDMLERIEKTLGSMKMLEKYSGHFYNWYSTRLGEVLSPRYISTVDSGNLAASLLFLRQALENIDKKNWPNKDFWNGLKDTIEVLVENINWIKNMNNGYDELYHTVSRELSKIKKIFPERITDSPKDWRRVLLILEPEAEKLSRLEFGALKNQLSDVDYDEFTGWFRKPLLQIRAQLEEIELVLDACGEQRAGVNQKISDILELQPFLQWKSRIRDIIQTCDEMVWDMDFRILYLKKRDLFSIGYNEDRAALDKSTYDLLASEARLASFIAIAKGEVPPQHWFKLSRRLTSIERNEILLSWGGTMFEYLMPVLFMARFDNTLLSNTYVHAVNWQRKYGESRNYPWGFSESGYGVVNLELQYQYRAFGAPGLGLKRGLAEDYVVAPYSSMLALMVQPDHALDNLRRLKNENAYGMNGFYEAVDYSPKRAGSEKNKKIVKMYMAHHQAMSLLALCNAIKDNLIQKIFHSNPLVKSCELLLQERIPRGIPIKEPRPIDVELEPGEEQKIQPAVDHSNKEALQESPARTHILSNGRYSTVITHAGTGYSAYDETALTRWRAERVKDAHGFFFYIKDLESGIYWSAAHRPVNKEADRYDTWFHAGKVQTARVDEWVETFTEICVSPEDNIELRKLTLTNYSNRPRKLEVTSYAEVVLNEQKADAAHPAFSNLFVQTEHVPEHHAVVAKRRSRTSEEEPVWLVHTIASEDLNSMPEPLQYETDREQFIGRGRSLDSPAAMDPGSRLSGSTGNVPDPIVSLRRVIELKPGEKRSITFGLGMVSSRENAVVMADQYDNPYATDRVFELASIYGRVELDHIGISGEQAHYFQKLGGALLYGNEQLRASEETLTRNRRTQSGLWAYGISGDLPVLLYRIRDVNHIRYVEQLLKAHMMWRLKGFAVDLVIIYDHPTSYIEELRDAIHRHVQASPERHLLNKRGGIFVIHGDDMPVDDRILLETVAAVYMQDKLAKIDFSTIDTKKREPISAEPYYRLARLSELNNDTPAVNSDLLFHNGYGGFSQTGKEYVIQLTLDSSGENLVYPPAPWINVIANPGFGFITSERGSDYTWSQNSRENRLTPWSNDAVIDPAGEALYIRDETHRRFWSPTPGPSPGSTHYEVRHGFGYSRFISRTLNIDQEVTKWVAVDDPVKLIRLRLTNTDLISRTLSVFYYLEWVLGAFRDQSSRYVVTELDQDLSTVFAQNAYNNEFAGRVAFAAQFTDAELIDESFTTDRTYFIGKNKGVTNPHALRNEHLLTKRFGAGFDPCAASQMQIKLKSGATADLYFMLGESASFESAKKIIREYRDSDVIESSLKDVQNFWDEKLGRIQISTPAPELDIMFNGWLQYQNIACRMWGRSGFYQSGGAYGFRDQLQDASSALYLDEQLARNQILKHAARQFREGDVLHWWHPPTGRGIRSKITDDLLWLPYVTAFYIETTNDRDLLDERVPFITARKLEEGEHEAYLTPENSEESASLYEHCCRAIDRSLTQGEHGLPLIGGGDWNDGMNRVGEQGKGESVWLGFFLYSVLSDFLPYCKLYDDDARIEKYEQYRKQLKKHLNRQGWDGKWYRRAFYDDGTPLGSAESDECKIDAIAQAWAVISGVAPAKKAKKALESAGNYLVSEEEGIIRLLTPAFDKTPKNPGYIKGYMPGVRENGGQYTHGALWLIKAYAEMGYGDLATRLIRMVTPVNHSTHKEDADRYKVEPYSVAADIYSEPPLVGMGGWTWYTGSAGWMYRVILESILGIRIVKGDLLTINPQISSEWEEYSVSIKNHERTSTYRITVTNKEKTATRHFGVTLDDKALSDTNGPVKIKMEPDGTNHDVKLQFKSS